eukprot:TRINITY_DN12812_c0_g1_i1.p1 TRINITY_DN12812_c0_g1~~TRINITY_DN12812_c0_g1_i1.p1  ORF type:complete len:178 (-),score=32.96 TRINITY_DN12812_c0_g1_i1:13-546(-)
MSRLVIRLRRKGRAQVRVYDVIVTYKHKSTSSGITLDKLGFYNPSWRENLSWLNLERVYYWLGKGAEPVGVTAKMIMMFDLHTRKNQSFRNWTDVNPQYPYTDFRAAKFNKDLYPQNQQKQRMSIWESYNKQLQINLAEGITMKMEKERKVLKENLVSEDKEEQVTEDNAEQTTEEK